MLNANHRPSLLYYMVQGFQASTLEYMDEHFDVRKGQCRGVLHCFTGTLEEARQLIDRGWLISFSGIVTFKRSTDLREVAKIVPADKFLIETDSPYLAPQPWRGKPCEPAYVVATAECLAEARGASLEEIAEQSTVNAVRFFGLSR